jgi:hypothetical protein
MGLLSWINLLLEARNKTAPPVRLDAASVAVLSKSLGKLAPGRRGWIAMKQAQWLFSETDAALTLRKFDENGERAVSNFAANQSCTPRLAGDRVIFTRNANWTS